MPDRIHILGLTRDELQAEFARLSLPAYRADQVRQWIFARRVDNWAAMTNLSKADRARFAELFLIASGQVVNHQTSADGVHKLLIAWHGVEGVGGRGGEGAKEEDAGTRGRGDAETRRTGEGASGRGGEGAKEEDAGTPGRGDAETGRSGEEANGSGGDDSLASSQSELTGDSSEAVMIPSEDKRTDSAKSAESVGNSRRTACISTQVGCPVGCQFCASGIGGLQRNLTAGEIVEQVWQLARVTLPANERISNVVLMGIGEPLANYDAVVKAIRLINASDGMDVGARKITLSTVGLPAQIRRLAEEDLQITLAISLHAPNQQLRAELIPWAARFPLDSLLTAAREYFDRTRREITLEYVMLEGVNTLAEHAEQLADIAHSLRCNVNLIHYNPVAEADFGFHRAGQATAARFRDRLIRRGVNVHIRSSRGLNIDAACGQLRRRGMGP